MNTTKHGRDYGREMARRACRSGYTMVMPRDENELFGISEYFNLSPREVQKCVGPLGVDVRELMKMSRRRAA